MLKPELEEIALEPSLQSFRFFKIESHNLPSYWHYHPELELTFIKKGKGIRFIGDSVAPFSDMDLVLVGESLAHNWFSILNGEQNKYECYVLQFPLDLLVNIGECAPLLTLFRSAEKGIHFESPSSKLMDSICHLETLDPIERYGALFAIFNELLKHDSYSFLASKSYRPISRQKKSQKRFTQINQYILENLNERLNVSDLASKSHMAPQSFCRWFKQHSGHSFISFLNRARIEKACQLLTLTDGTVKEVAYDTGFETISHFNRVFKKLKGVSPKVFKRDTVHK